MIPDLRLIGIAHGLRQTASRVPEPYNLDFTQAARLAEICASVPPRWHAVLGASLRSDPTGDLLQKIAIAIIQ